MKSIYLLFIVVLFVCPRGMAAGKSLPTVVIAPEIKLSSPVRVQQGDSTPLRDLIQKVMETADILLDANFKSEAVIAHADKDLMVIEKNHVVSIQSSVAYPVDTDLVIHRPESILVEPSSKEKLGILSKFLGIVRIRHANSDHVLGEITFSHREIFPGDVVSSLPFKKEPIVIMEDPRYSTGGHIIHVGDDLELAGGGQVVVVGLGRRERAYPGLTLPVVRRSGQLGRSDADPPLRIGKVTLFRIGEKSSLAFVDESNEPIEKGDRVGGVTPKK